MEEPEAKIIWTMTCVSGSLDELDNPKTRFRCCTWGYYFERRNAEIAIETNSTDMSELGYYRYAILCCVGEGPLAIGEEIQWYEFIWNRDVPPRESDGVVIPEFIRAERIAKPEQYMSMAFAML